VPVTPARSYPYPGPTDPADVPQSLEDLALAVEEDVQFQYDRRGDRTVAKAWRTSTPTTITNWVSGAAWFLDLADGFQVNVNASFTLSGTRLYPTEPGYYLVIATISYPVVSTVSPYPQGRHTVVYANGTTVLGRDSFNDNIPTGDGSHESVAVGGRNMNGTTDYFGVAARIYSDNLATIPSVRFNTRSLTAIKMTL